MALPQIFCLQHTPHEHPGALTTLLDHCGFPWKILRLDLHTPLPKTEEILGVVSLGGPMSANDAKNHTWITQELQLFEKLLHQKKPIFGICLGGQLLAKALGAKIDKNPEPEVGWLALEWLEFPFSKQRMEPGNPLPKYVYQFHEDRFDVPQTALRLAKSERCENQAFLYQNLGLGLQFHPEVDPLTLNEWFASASFEEDLENFRTRSLSGGVQSVAEQRRLTQACVHDQGLLLSVLFDWFISRIPKSN